MTALAPSIEAQARRTERRVLDAVLRHGEPLVLANAPPGAGKTTHVEAVVATAVPEIGSRVAVVTPRAEQSYDFVRRLIEHYRPMRTQLLHASKRQPPQDLGSLPLNVVTDPAALARGPGVVVGTAAKFGLSVADLGREWFDL